MGRGRGNPLAEPAWYGSFSVRVRAKVKVRARANPNPNPVVSNNANPSKHIKP